MASDQATLQTTLAYRFKNTQLLKLALTHRSFGADNNERLEFLGDALLDLIVGESLFNHHPAADEGEAYSNSPLNTYTFHPLLEVYQPR